MGSRILVDGVYAEEIRVVIQDNNKVEDYDYETAAKRQIKGNIYLAKITRVEPSLQAAFVRYGHNKQGFLPFSEIHPDYYQIPIADKQRLLEESYENFSSSLLSEDNEEAWPEEQIIESELDIADPQDTHFHDHEEVEPHSPSREEEELEDTSDQRRWSAQRRYKIQEVIKRNQIILVQAIKEERGNKGATLSTFISLAGRYCVLMPNTCKQGGISRKISNPHDRKELRSILNELHLPKGTSIIVRTAGVGKNAEEIQRDYDYLLRLWHNIRDSTLSAKAPAFIHAESGLLKRIIRDVYDGSFEEIVVEGHKAYEDVREFMGLLLPQYENRVKAYRGKVPIFTRFRVEEELTNLYSPKATLASGGYIIINSTEALISIDVNSGRSTRERNIEETALKTNLEAAREVARQLRLRDLSGLIVIDFIDMEEAKHRMAVERTLKEALQHDKARIRIGRISLFGLLEMSRQRLRPTFLEAHTITCSTCKGEGVIRSPDSTAISILRALEHELSKESLAEIHVFASPAVIHHIVNYKRVVLCALETHHQVKLIFTQDKDTDAGLFSMETIKRDPKSSLSLEEPLSLATNSLEQEWFLVEKEEKEISDTSRRSKKKPVSQDHPNSRNGKPQRKRDDGRDKTRKAPLKKTFESLLKGLWKKLIE